MPSAAAGAVAVVVAAVAAAAAKSNPCGSVALHCLTTAVGSSGLHEIFKGIDAALGKNSFSMLSYI